jgi:hypothetical protein
MIHAVRSYSVIAVLPTEETLIDHGKDGETNTMKTEEAWSGICTAADLPFSPDSKHSESVVEMQTGRC